MNQLNVSLQHSIATLAANGWSARRIARELGIHRETVGRYLRGVEADSKPANLPAGLPGVAADWFDPEINPKLEEFARH